MYRVLASPQRIFSGYHPTFMRRPNLTLLIPFRLCMMFIHFTALICAADASDSMIINSSLLSEYSKEDYMYLRRATDACLATSFIFLFFNGFGIITARTLRSGIMNFMHGCFHATAAILLIISWSVNAHVTRIWQIFYIFSIIPTGFEIIALCESWARGMNNYF